MTNCRDYSINRGEIHTGIYMLIYVAIYLIEKKQ